MTLNVIKSVSPLLTLSSMYYEEHFLLIIASPMLLAFFGHLYINFGFPSVFLAQLPMSTMLFLNGKDNEGRYRTDGVCFIPLMMLKQVNRLIQ